MAQKTIVLTGKNADRRSDTLTMKEAFQIQAQQLLEWEPKLKAQVMNELLDEVERQNKLLEGNPNPYAVWRGYKISEFIENWGRKK